MLSQYVEVEYEGTDKILTRSPVFDSINMPVQVEGKLVGQTGVQLITLFLVYENGKKKRLMWMRMENCNIVIVSKKIHCEVEGRISTQEIPE